MGKPGNWHCGGNRRQESVMAMRRQGVAIAIAVRRPQPGLSADFAEALQAFKALFDPYRPERHYMRGPGPKWRAKHASVLTEAPTGAGLYRARG
jgi:hypothetical protein